MSECIDCKAVIFENGSRYCKYDGCISHDNYDDTDCEYFDSKTKYVICPNCQKEVGYLSVYMIPNKINKVICYECGQEFRFTLTGNELILI